MDEPRPGDLRNQVESRLDDLFDEAKGAPEDGADDRRDPSDSSPLAQLKTIVLSVDWEITDETLANLMGEAKRLEDVYHKEKVPFTLLQILASVGKYIKFNKGRSHPATVKLINSIYLALEKTILSEEITQQEKERILIGEVTKFKKLKEEIAVRRESKREEKPDQAIVHRATQPNPPPREAEEEPPREAVPATAPHEAFAIAVEEIKDLIRAEFKALRAEIGLWRSSK